MVFVTAGMGGGTGTGAAPVIAQIARDCGALTVGVVTKPFASRARSGSRLAEEGIERAREGRRHADRDPEQSPARPGPARRHRLVDAFRQADAVLLNAAQGISDLITVPGLINVDFADVRTIMSGLGRALMGTGIGHGKRRALEAAELAISSPLLEDVTIHGAHRHPDQHHRRPGPHAARGQRGAVADPGGRPRGLQHHLRLGDRSQPGRGPAPHRDRDRLRPPRARRGRARAGHPCPLDRRRVARPPAVAGAGARHARPRPARQPAARRRQPERQRQPHARPHPGAVARALAPRHGRRAGASAPGAGPLRAGRRVPARRA